ncbi:MAG: hypothetical protein B6229_04925 [Spirochaetaceae bacterium 4572_7]|nr:MAG: hypothetical protein B6229_04925 [Spirochaetaceae bacterium 4572_7]
MRKIFNRLIRLTGEPAFKKLQCTSVIIFGVGGVGSWCAEALARSGIGSLTIVDSDIVCETNINRQLQATTSSIGEVKVDVLKARLLDINPNININAIRMIYSSETKDNFDLNQFDYIIDAIDSIDSKVELIIHALSSSGTLFSSFGAASKMDPSRIVVKQIWKTYGCPLGRSVRNKLKKRRINDKFLCVFSDEVLPRFEIDDPNDGEGIINGSITHITGSFGFRLASLVIEDVIKI